jgi:hypothetical protein
MVIYIVLLVVLLVAPSVIGAVAKRPSTTKSYYCNRISLHTQLRMRLIWVDTQSADLLLVEYLRIVYSCK